MRQKLVGHYRAVSAAVLVLVCVAVLAGCRGGEVRAQQYHCPMHPAYVSDRPGDCPICGMRLVPIDEPAGSRGHASGSSPSTATDAPAHPPAGPEAYTCPMHPEIRQAMPGKCPVCGMDLVKAASGGAAEGSGAGAATGAVGEPKVELGGEGARLAGVRTVEATTGVLERRVRAVGTVVADETGVREVTTKVGGFVEKLYVNAVGQQVRAGAPLFELYSPELLASQEEYVRALETEKRFAGSSLPEVREGGADLARAARRRLELFDVPAEVIARLERTRTPERRVLFRAPFSGVVTAKTVLEGQRIEAGMNLMTVSDLSRVWVIAQVYEAEAAAAREGRRATVSLPYGSSATLTGRVGFVYPTVDTESRTLQVRVELPNPRMTLKPGMFVNVDLAADEARGLVVPDSALVDSGTRQVVFVRTGEGAFTPREVRVTMRADGRAVIERGLEEGERVAVAATFLLDSESRLREAVAAAGRNGKDE